MFSTVAAIIVGIALILPGFLAVDLAETRRARGPRSDWELVLRALTYALVIQIAVGLTGWTSWLLDLTDNGREWKAHLHEIALFLGVDVLVAPTLLGLGLNRLLRRAEQRGNLTGIHYALGGRDARQAWDYIFERFGSGFVIVSLKPGAPGRSPHFLAKWGEASWAPQAPSELRDVYFEEVWPCDPKGYIDDEYDQPRGMWVAIDQIDAMQFADPPAKPSSGWITRILKRDGGQ